MITLKDFLQEQFQDKKFEEEFYRGLEKTRIAAQIAYFREKRGLTQAQLAKMLGTSQSTIARLENPFYENYSLNTLRKIAKILNLELVVSLKEKDEQSVQDSETKRKDNISSITWIPKNKEDYLYNIRELENKKIVIPYIGEAIAS